MHLTFNDKDLEGGNWIPEGEHEVTIVGIDKGQSKAGEEMLTFTLKDRFGREEKERILTAEKNRWKLAKLAMAAGFSKDDLRANGLSIPSLSNRRLLLVKKKIGVRMYEGKERPEFSHDYFQIQSSSASPAAAQSEDIPF